MADDINETDLEQAKKDLAEAFKDPVAGFGNSGIQLVGTTSLFSGNESIGPMGLIATGEAVECGGGAIPVYVEGQGFRGCYSPDESWIKPFLDKTGKFATFPADDPAISNLIDPEEGKKLQELIEQYGEDVVRDMKNKYDELVDFIGNIPEDPLGSLQKMIEIFVEGTTGISADCQKQVTGTETELETWLLDCVNVNIIGAIGLPIPGALGGILAGVTLRDLKDAAGKIGTTIEDILSGDFKCGTEKEPEDCTPESLLNKMGDWVVGAVEEIFGGLEDIDVDTILGKLGDIFGGVLGGIIYGEFKDLINGEIEDVIGIPVLPFKDLDDCESKGLETIQAEDGSLSCGECKQPGFTPTGPNGECIDPNAVEDYDCSEAGREQRAGARSAADCGPCTETTEDGTPFVPNPTTGFCEDPTVDELTLTEQQQLCKDTGRKYDDLNDVCLEECENAQYVVQGDGNCGPQEEPLIECPQNTPNAGQMVVNEADCGEPFDLIECPQNTPNAGQMVVNEADCGAATTCPDPNRQTKADGSCGECESGFKLNEEGLCEKEEVIVDPEEPYEPVCSQPRPTGLVTFDLIDQQRAWDRKCGGVTGPSPCDQHDRVTNEDGSCGPCKPGFVEDPQGLVECIRAPEECNDCSCAEYAAANPQECGETPTDTTETGGGASVSGGAGGAFSPFLAGISYTPQPVPEIIQSPQAGMFTQAAPQQPSRNTDILGGSIVAGLLGKYMV